MLVVPLRLASFKLHPVGHLPTPAAEMPPGVFLVITNLSSTTRGAVAIFGGIAMLLAIACSICDTKPDQLFSISTNSSLQGSVSWVHPKCKAKDELLHGECREKLVCASRFLTMCSSCCRHSTSRISTCVRWSLFLNLILCHLFLTGFPNRCLMSSSCALQVFPSTHWRPKDRGTRCQVQYICRFFPTLGEVLHVDTTEAQSLNNWIEIADGRDRREARASHPTSRHLREIN